MSKSVRLHFRGAHACSVLVFAFCENNLFAKYAIAECDRPHATSVRSSEEEFGSRHGL
jgi:hypothetical protein